MSEEGQPATAVETTEAPSSIVKEDGSLVENWHTLLSDETLHDDQTLPRFKNVESLAKSYLNVRKQVPMDKIAIPTENERKVS